MDKLVSQVNASADLASVDIDDAEGTVFPGVNPVLATPGAFLGGVAVASATVAAYEQGKG